MIKYHVFQKAVEFEIGRTETPLRLKLEVYLDSRSENRFLARVFRYDIFRVMPTSAIHNTREPQLADHELLVLDPMFGELELQGNTVEDALDYALEMIQRQLGSFET